MSPLRTRSGRGGFTLVEVLVASALVGMSLVVMFGFHSQAVRSNMNARRLTDCTYLAQTQMERLLAMDWTSTARPTDITDAVGPDPSTLSMWDNLEWPASATAVNALYGTDPAQGPLLYTVTWDVADMDADATWIRLRVRCTYPDSTFNTFHGTTISSYRFRDS